MTKNDDAANQNVGPAVVVRTKRLANHDVMTRNRVNQPIASRRPALAAVITVVKAHHVHQVRDRAIRRPVHNLHAPLLRVIPRPVRRLLRHAIPQRVPLLLLPVTRRHVHRRLLHVIRPLKRVLRPHKRVLRPRILPHIPADTTPNILPLSLM